jgi:hypothetical protein
LETAANLLELLERLFGIFSKCALKTLNNQTDFDSAIRRFDPSRPSQPVRLLSTTHSEDLKGRQIARFSLFGYASPSDA